MTKAKLAPSAARVRTPRRAGAAATVSVVVNTYNQARFLTDSIESCLAQTTPPDEIIVVDDGSTTDDPGAVVRRYPGVKLITQTNQGLAAARNTGLHAARGAFIAFLDADDRLLPAALATGLACMQANPHAALVYGAHRSIDQAGNPVPGRTFNPVGGDARLDFLRHGNLIGMHATVLYRRQALLEAGGFDAALRACEDYDLYLRMVAGHPIAGHDDLIAEYRQHPDQMSGDHEMMLRVVNGVIDRHAGEAPDRATRAAAAAGRRGMNQLYTLAAFRGAGLRLLTRSARPGDGRELVRSFLSVPLPALGVVATKAARTLAQKAPFTSLKRRLTTPARGKVRFGDFARGAAISENFGFDRGQPIDRYYIDAFLAENAADIRGRVLEIGDNSYTLQFGGAAVTRSEVLHANPDNPDATYVGDLCDPTVLPKGVFDCIVLTQTLHMIFDVRRVLETLHDSLAPGGVLLITTPGITPIDKDEWCWYWSFTPLSLQRLLEARFEPGRIATKVRGNVFAAVSFLHGLCIEETGRARVDPVDPSYPVIVAARAVKGA